MMHCVVQWLEKTACRYPDHIAFVDEKASYTYQQVRRMALSIASHIKDRLLGRKHPIAVFIELIATPHMMWGE